MVYLRLVVLAIVCLPGAALAVEAAVSVLPLKTLVEAVAGDRARVQVMVGPGQSPARFDPGPRQLAALETADVYFRVGVPFEAAWMERIASVAPDMRIVDLRERLALLGATEHEHGDGDVHADATEEGEHEGHDDREAAFAGTDPHVWTSPSRAMRMVEHVRDVLMEIDPAHAEEYRANAARHVERIDAVDASVRERLAGLQGRAFLVFHPAWAYFADDYGLRQIAIEWQGKSPGPARLARVVDQARAEGIRVVIVQRQFSRGDADVVARAIDGRVVSVDPLAADYLRAVRTVADTIAEALR